MELSPLSTRVDGFANAQANDVNNLGDAVGGSLRYSGNTVLGRAVIWREGGSTPTDLNSLVPFNSGWTLIFASAINDAGVIVGYGQYDPDGEGPLPQQTLAYQLTPVPEPSLAGVLVGAVVMARRRRRAG